MRKRKPRELRRDARRYKEARASCICVGCWYAKAETGRTMCSVCLLRRRERSRAYYGKKRQEKAGE